MSFKISNLFKDPGTTKEDKGSNLKSLMYDDDKLNRDLDFGSIADFVESSTEYDRILQDVYRFRYSGYGNTNIAQQMNNLQLYDQPNFYFFKLFFFYNNTDEDNTLKGNLLSRQISEIASTSELFNKEIENRLKTETTSSGIANSAMNYLLINNELERASYLSSFIDLLQKINVYSPWYFQELGGLEEFMKRDYFINPEGLSIKDEPRQITIKTLQDSIDDRIGTLLDLYRAACFSDVLKKEVIPANLRKFDMGIFIVSIPVKGLNTSLLSSDGTRALRGRITNTDVSNETELKVSCKYIECLNCEIDPTCIASSYSSFSNKDFDEGMKYDIKINVDEVKENRYNQFICMNIGDFVDSDLIQQSNIIKETELTNSTRPQGDFTENRNTKESVVKEMGNGEFAERLDKNGTVLSGWDGSKKEKDGYLASTLKGALKTDTNFIKSKVERLLLGNIYTPTFINKVETGISALAVPNLQGTLSRAAQLKPKKKEKNILSPTSTGTGRPSTEMGPPMPSNIFHQL